MFENLLDAAVLKTVTVSVVLLGSDDLIVAAHSGVFQDVSPVVEAFAVAAVVAGAFVVDVAAVVAEAVVIEAVFVEAIAVTAVDIVAAAVVVEAVVVAVTAVADVAAVVAADVVAGAVVVEAVVVAVTAIADVAAVVVAVAVTAVADLFQSGRCYFEFLFRFCLNRFQIFRPLEQIRNLIVCRYCFFFGPPKIFFSAILIF